MSETQVSERQHKVLKLITQCPTLSARDMSETLSVSQRTIERDLAYLQKQKLVRREGTYNAGKWVIVK